MTQTRVDDDIRSAVKPSAVPCRVLRCASWILNSAHLFHWSAGRGLLRGYIVMKGYYNMPEATVQAIDEQGWLHSGDLGIMDEDGYVAITGRHKDMIIRGGENIYPKESKNFYYGMDGVRDVRWSAFQAPRSGKKYALLSPSRMAFLTRPRT